MRLFQRRCHVMLVAAAIIAAMPLRQLSFELPRRYAAIAMFFS